MEKFDKWPLLGSITSPDDVKALTAEQLDTLADEIRSYLAFRVEENGGHLASNLGVVELTLALHRVFDSPRDHVIYDVGHQSYVHKLMTGRKEQFDTLRQAGGISGFTKRSESRYDAFGAGHSSTSISAAVGLAQAEALRGSDAWTVAVIGDGALTGGLAYEALNNCKQTLRLILIINENEMSISPNTGRLARHLAKMRTSRNYLQTKKFTSSALRHIPLLGRLLYRILRWFKRRIKRMLYRENWFEQMGMRYFGPADGNDLESVEMLLRHAKTLGGLAVLHFKTKKGKGYAPAEENPNLYHALPPCKKAANGASFSGIFGETLTQMAEEDKHICAITAAMSDGTGLEPFRSAHPKRFFDVGIAEGHAVTFAAGLAAGGERPVVAVYSTFLQRAYDNVLHDVALQNLPVTLCIDRAGLNAGDGATHHGIFDVAMLSQIPNVRIYAPVTAAGLRASLHAALEQNGLAAIRYPNGTENQAIVQAFYPDGEDENAPRGIRAWGDAPEVAQLTVVTHGRIAAVALEVAARLRAAGTPVQVLLCEYLTPYGDLSREIAPMLGGNILFLEEEILSGGFGMNLSDALKQNGALEGRSYQILATVDGFLTPGVGQTPLQAAGLDVDSVLAVAQKMISKEN
ncbi:MAG: 1-deoxy-D-xylulose-5-phosphate synthase [Clostridia bacterium]|nr:1-deoxy-D-xylulose-5-phosphate synthase [Clostridia bacterium]